MDTTKVSAVLDPEFFTQFKELKTTLEKQRIAKQEQKMAEHNRYTGEHGTMAIACTLCGRMCCSEGRYCKEYVDIPNIIRSWMIKKRFPGVQGHQRCQYCGEPRAFNIKVADLQEEINKYRLEQTMVSSPRA